MTYTYDALNRRVRIDSPGNSSLEFIYDPQGRHTSEWDAVNHWEQTGWFYWGDTRLGLYTGGTTEFEHQDWLGTERSRTAVNGTVLGTYTSLPFGDGYTASCCDWDTYHFATLDQDNSANEHAQFREYSNLAGRWFSPDHYQGSYDATNPQSLNRYAYVLNAPLSYIYPSGLIICAICGPVGGGDGGNGGGSGAGGSGGGGQGCGFSPASVPVGTSLFSPEALRVRPECGSNGSSGGGGGNDNNNQAPNNATQQQPQKNPFPPGYRVAKAFQAAWAAGDASIIFVTSGVHIWAAGAVLVGGCGDPTPGVAVTCPAGVFAAGALGTGGALLARLGVSRVTDEVIPEFKQAITCEQEGR